MLVNLEFFKEIYSFELKFIHSVCVGVCVTVVVKKRNGNRCVGRCITVFFCYLLLLTLLKYITISVVLRTYTLFHWEI